MKSGVAALIAGIVGGGISVGYLAWLKKSHYENRVRAIEAAAAGDGPASTALARRAVEMREAVESHAEAYAAQVAQQTADAHIRDRFGLTPERVASIERLARIF